MIEEHVKPKKKDQIKLDEEVALRLQAELQAEFNEEQRLARERTQQELEANIALIETWDGVQAKINADYQFLMLQRFDREDLYKLVKAKYGSTRPVEDLDLLLWGNLKTMFKPHIEDKVWKMQQRYNVVNWKLYDSCGIHCLSLQFGHIYMRIVAVKSHLNAVGVTAAQVKVNTAQKSLYKKTSVIGKKPILTTVEQFATSPTKKKKPPRNRQKRMIQSDDAPRQTAWTIKEEMALANAWRAISKIASIVTRGSKMAFGVRFWSTWKGKQNSTVFERTLWYAKNGRRVGDEDRAMIHYEFETDLPFKLRHCWEILKDILKWQEIELPNFSTESGGSKRHKSSVTSSFNTESGEACINLNTNVCENNEDEVEKIRRTRGRDKRELLGKIKEQQQKILEIKRREVECHEREIATQEYRLEQEDMRFYLQPYDHFTLDQRKAMDEIRAKIKANYNLQY
uniref:Uncharacterized protein n=1 Tax=Tanacetum cinerariifolium TaxID=118510 RepID=A0A6L2M9D6_TANCI|nr:hypothetical protein [Tanacetum cinerariifolium]